MSYTKVRSGRLVKLCIDCKMSCQEPRQPPGCYISWGSNSVTPGRGYVEGLRVADKHCRYCEMGC